MTWQFDARVYHLMTTDGLTAVYNRRYFLQAFSNHLRQCHHDRVPIALLLIDIDNLARVNETNGLIGGDVVIKEVARRISERTGPEVVVARYGGQRFTVSLPGASAPEAILVAEKVRTDVAGAGIEHEGCVISVTVSSGVAAPNLTSGPWTDVQRFLGAAEEGLAKAKRAGRNRVAG